MGVARRGVALGASVAICAAPPVAAQENVGGLFLLVPIAARSVGVGGAHVADSPGTESVLSNPAGLAGIPRREGALHYGQDFSSNRFLASVAVPSRRIGTLALSAMVDDLGSQEVTSSGGTVVGRTSPRNIFLAGSYASTVGRRLALGVTYRFIQVRFDCTGQCVDPENPNNAAENSSTSSVDFGVQYDLGSRLPLTLGAALRHVGSSSLQVQDREQTDALPTQVSVGARYTVPNVAKYVGDTRVRLLTEVVSGVRTGATREVRLGVEGVYRAAFALRAGYVTGSGVADGPAVGFGYVGRRVAFDLARQFTGLSVDAGEPPTFAAFRYAF